MTRGAVAVVGPAEATDEEQETAYAVGRGLAEAGLTVVTGGLGGVMAAACRGARDAGGVTVGVLPGTDPAAGNPWLTVALPTGLGEARNALVVRAASAVIAVGGSWGTLSEIALAARLALPAVAVGGWEVRDASNAAPQGGPVHVTTATEAVSLVLATLG